MTCGFCGCEFDEETAKKGCGGCPGGCHSVHCPRCNYRNPAVPKYLERLKRMVKK